MARETVLLCDAGDGTCRQPAVTYKMWREGELKASSIDLCDEHAKPLLTLMESAEQVDLPSKPRVRMEVTTLRTTPKTKHLKKKG
jgi:hypothetical protein